MFHQLKLINARWHEIKIEDNKTLLNIGDIKKEVSLKEKMNIEKNIDGKLPSIIYNPTGKFCLPVGNKIVRKDGKLSLENKSA